MLVISLYIVIIGFLRAFLYKKVSDKFFVLIACFMLFLISALRSVEFGSDVMGYIHKYNDLVDAGVLELWNNVLNNVGKDPFFYFSSKLISLTGAHHQVWIAILSGVFIYALGITISKYSDEPFLSLIVTIALGYFYFTLTGLRQGVALSIILLSYTYMRETKLLPFVLTVFIASLFHSSAIVFLLAYPLSYLKIGLKYLIIGAVAIFITVFFSGAVRELVNLLGWNENISGYSQRVVGLSYSGFIILLSIFVFCLLESKQVVDSDVNNLSLYNLLFIGLVFQLFSVVIAEFFRISMYFSIFSIILIPIAINAIQKPNLRLYAYLIITVLSILYIHRSNNLNDFAFYWQLD